MIHNKQWWNVLTCFIFISLFSLFMQNNIWISKLTATFVKSSLLKSVYYTSRWATCPWYLKPNTYEVLLSWAHILIFFKHCWRFVSCLFDVFNVDWDSEKVISSRSLDHLVQDLEHLFEVDYLLPRTIMACVSAQHIQEAEILGKIPPEICSATFCHYLGSQHMHFQDYEKRVRTNIFTYKTKPQNLMHANLETGST